MKINLKNSIDFLTIALAFLSVLASIFYKLFNLSNLSVSLILAISFLIIVLFRKRIKNFLLEKNKHSIKEAKIDLKPKKSNIFIFSLLYISSLIICFVILLTHRNEKAIISPWELDLNFFFILLIIATFSLIWLYKLNSRFSLLFTVFFALLINSVAIIIYKYGFGFDFFIHGATMDLIDKNGAVEPKPFYYLGQYSILVIFHKITQIPLHYLHLLLVPLLASSLLVFKLYNSSKYFTKTKFSRYMSLLLLIALPLGIFYNTTPQNLAWIFFILVILKGLGCCKKLDLVYMYTLSFAALLTQPIAGIPALFLSICVTIYHSDIKKLKPSLLRLAYLASASALPLAFLLLNKDSKTNLSDRISEERSESFFNYLISKFQFSIPSSENIILNFIYFFENNISLLAFSIIFVGFIIALRNKKTFPLLKIYLALAFSFFLSSIVTSNLSFDFLIDYERFDYSMRIFFSAVLLLIPFVLSVFTKIFDNFTTKEIFLRLSIIIFLSLLIPSFVYLSYPRIDNYHNSHSYSVSLSDIKAVRWIEENSKNNDYLVLANQQTSVAALREYGFNRYYRHNIFYYPIPTGGPLYPYYLEMVNKGPNRQTMIEAMNLVGVDTAYLSISKYWWASPKIIDEARIIADEYHEIDNGEVVVFRFDK